MLRRVGGVFLLGILLVAGCGRSGLFGGGPDLSKDLTPSQYEQLSDAQKVRYKNVIVRVPDTWGGVLLPFDSGPYPSPIEKTIHQGDLNTLIGLYNQSLFELEHPRVKIEYINFDMWSDTYQSALAVALSAHHAPAFYVGRNLPQTIDQGMYADITDLLNGWDQAKYQPQSTVHEGIVNGRNYLMGSNQTGAIIIRYRKDWFREAGIFNEHGEPGPRSDWTYDDFRRYAKLLTDPAKNRFGFSDMEGDFLYNQCHGLDLYIPDPTGKHTWTFNDRDPDLLKSLQNARDMVNVDKSVLTSVTTGWFDWHHDFDASHAAMIPSLAFQPPQESIDQPYKLGKDKPFKDTVGMVVPPTGPTGINGMVPWTNPIGFDPTLSPAQLKAAFDWLKSYFYGDLWVNRMRESAKRAQLEGRQNPIYAEMLVLPYKPEVNLLDRPLSTVFPWDYLHVYDIIHKTPGPPLPRNFGLQEPSDNELQGDIKAMYSEAISSSVDLKSLIAKYKDLINRTVLDFRGPADAERLRRYIAARTDFYRQYYPKYYETAWKGKLATYDKAP